MNRSLTPTGVEHPETTIAYRVGWEVNRSLTPTGVEHESWWHHCCVRYKVNRSLTPTGVEHLLVASSSTVEIA